MTIKEALKASGSTAFLFGKSIKLAESKLMDGEGILYALTTNISSVPLKKELKPKALDFDNKMAVVVVITDQRIFACSEIVGTSSFKEIRIDSIKSYDSARLLSNCQIRIQGSKDMLVIDANQKQEKDIEKIISELRSNYRHSNSITKKCTNCINDLYQLKQLLDDGIITQEDFDIKKRQILGL